MIDLPPLPLLCPNCQSADVVEQGTVSTVSHGYYMLSGGDPPGPFFVESGDSEAIWDSYERDEHEAFCRVCSWEGSPEELVPRVDHAGVDTGRVHGPWPQSISRADHPDGGMASFMYWYMPTVPTQ